MIKMSGEPLTLVEVDRVMIRLHSGEKQRKFLDWADEEAGSVYSLDSSPLSTPFLSPFLTTDGFGSDFEGVNVAKSLCTRRLYSPLLLHHLLELHTFELYPPLPLMVQDLSVWLLHQDGLCFRLLFLLLLCTTLLDCGWGRPSFRRRVCSRCCSCIRDHGLGHYVGTVLRRWYPRRIIHDSRLLRTHDGEKWSDENRGSVLRYRPFYTTVVLQETLNYPPAAI